MHLYIKVFNSVFKIMCCKLETATYHNNLDTLCTVHVSSPAVLLSVDLLQKLLHGKLLLGAEYRRSCLELVGILNLVRSTARPRQRANRIAVLAGAKLIK